MLTLLQKHLYRQSQYSQTWESKCLALRAQYESEGWGFESLSGRDIFCLKIFDTFTRTPVSVSKMNAVAHAQLAFQLLTLLQKHLYHQSQYSETWDINVWPW